MAFDLVAFDCDGVLVDTEPLVNRVFVELVGEQGPRLDVESSLVRFTGVSMAARVSAVSDEHGWMPSVDFLHDFDRRLTLALESTLEIVPGVEDVVRGLVGARCVVSNGSPDEIVMKLRRVGLLDAFQPHLFSAAERPHSKPHPDVYLYAVASMGAVPERAAAVEDSVPGVQAATAAGLTVFGYAGATSGDTLSRLGARVFRKMSELPALLDEAT